jgi:hypothetical protein
MIGLGDSAPDLTLPDKHGNPVEDTVNATAYRNPTA